MPFWATAADGTELVVRVGIEERPYSAEAAVLARVRAAGIPVPEVAGVCRVEGRPVSVLVRVEGEPLSELGHGDDREARCVEAGEWLARVHRVDASGLDLVPATSLDEVLDVAARLEHLLPPADAGTIGAAASRLDALRTAVVPALCHGDFGAGHVLAAEGRVTAIIDWEWASFGDPSRDLAWWQVYDELGGAAGVRAGYGPGDDARVRAWMFAICINATNFRMGQDDPAGVAEALARARTLLIEHTFD